MMKNNPITKLSMIKSIHNEWRQISTINWDHFMNDHVNLLKKQSGLYLFCEQVSVFDSIIWHTVYSNDFNNYYSNIQYLIELLQQTKRNLSNYLSEMFYAANEILSTSKFQKIDMEIDNYQNLINNLQELIDQNIEVLTNQHRIDLLVGKIEHLNEIKNQFVINKLQRDDKNLKIFLDECNNIVQGKQKVKLQSSLSHVLSKHQDDNLEQLINFLDRYLYRIVVFIDQATDVANLFLNAKIEGA